MAANHPLRRKKPVVDWKNDLQIQGAGRKSQKQPTPFVGIKPYGKSQINPRQCPPPNTGSNINSPPPPFPPPFWN
jgi:hypothetical protein